MHSSRRARLPLLEVPPESLLPDITPKAHHHGSKPKASSSSSSTVKRTRTPAVGASFSGTDPAHGSDGWLSPSKRRVLFAEGLLSPSSHAPSHRRGLFPSSTSSPFDDRDSDESSAVGVHESPVSRALFSARDIEPDVINAFAAAHSSHTTTPRGSACSSAGSSSTPGSGSRAGVVISGSAKKASLRMMLATRDNGDASTVVDHDGPASHSGLSSPATLAESSPRLGLAAAVASPGPRRTTTRTSRFSEAILLLGADIISTPSASAPGPTGSSSSLLAPPLPITSTPKAPSSSAKASKQKLDFSSLPSTYSSNPSVSLAAPELHFDRPTLGESMSFVEGSRHYPGFVVRADTPPRALAGAEESDAEVGPGRDEEAMDEDEEEDDKENVLASILRLKRKKHASSSGSRAGTPVRELAPILESHHPHSPSTPTGQKSPERRSKRLRMSDGLGSPTKGKGKTPSKVGKSPVKGVGMLGSPLNTAVKMTPEKRAERRRVMESEVDGF